MQKQQILPTVLIVVDIFAALGYIGVDTRKVIYWISAAVLTASVTY